MAGMRVNWTEVLLTIVVIFWVGTCAINKHLERECMVQCSQYAPVIPDCEQCVRSVQECEIICDK